MQHRYEGAPPGPGSMWGQGGVLGPYERGRVDRLGGRARVFAVTNWVVGFITLGLGVLMAVLGSGAERVAGVGMTLAGLVPLLSGYYYFRAGGALRRVSETTGDGVRELMEALGTMRNAFRVEAAVLVVCAVTVTLFNLLGPTGR